MEDHGRFYPKAQHLKSKLYHNACGGVVSGGDKYSWNDRYEPWDCHGCQQSWSNATMFGFSPAQLAERFHNRPDDFDRESVTLVDKEEKGKRYTALVPVTEAHLYKKAKI